MINEEDFGDFPSEYKHESKEPLVGEYRAESTLYYKSGKWDHNKNSTHFDGSTSWFKDEELIEDLLDLTVLEETKRGPA